MDTEWTSMDPVPGKSYAGLCHWHCAAYQPALLNACAVCRSHHGAFSDWLSADSRSCDLLSAPFAQQQLQLLCKEHLLTKAAVQVNMGEALECEYLACCPACCSSHVMAKDALCAADWTDGRLKACFHRVCSLQAVLAGLTCSLQPSIATCLNKCWCRCATQDRMNTR